MAMLEDGLEPERVARILRVTVEELAQLTGDAIGMQLCEAVGDNRNDTERIES